MSEQKILDEALEEFLANVHKRGMALPIEVKVVNARWATVKTFIIHQGGKTTMRHQPRSLGFAPSNGSFTLPVRIVGKDRNGCVARMRIDAQGCPEKTEFLN